MALAGSRNLWLLELNVGHCVLCPQVVWLEPNTCALARFADAYVGDGSCISLCVSVMRAGGTAISTCGGSPCYCVGDLPTGLMESTAPAHSMLWEACGVCLLWPMLVNLAMGLVPLAFVLSHGDKPM